MQKKLIAAKTHHEAEKRPVVDEISISIDGVGFREVLSDQLNDPG